MLSNCTCFAGTVLFFFTVVHVVLCFGFVTKTVGLSCLLGYMLGLSRDICLDGFLSVIFCSHHFSIQHFPPDFVEYPELCLVVGSSPALDE